MIPETLSNVLLLLWTVLPGDELLAIRVGKAETISNGTIEHAVILVEGKKIVEIGEDLIVERGIPIIDRPDWVATPGLVDCHSRIGLSGRSGRSFDPELKASGELYPDQEVYRKLLEAGVTTLGLVPAGSGIPGQAVAVRTLGDDPEAVILKDPAYLEIYLEANQASKKMLRDAFDDVKKYDDKVQKAREKWEKDQEKKKKKSKSKKEDEEKKDEGGKEEEKDDTPDYFVPPEPDPKIVPFLALRDHELTALVNIRKSADYLHLLDVLDGQFEFDWFLRVPLRDDIDLYEIAERLGERKLRVVMDPEITLQPSTRRERNLPAELQRAGVEVALTPRSDSLDSHREWMTDVGLLVAEGLDRQAALAAVTLEAAEALGLADRLGSLEKGKDANIVFWDGDPFEPATRVRSVMIEGEFVEKEVGQ